MNISQRSKYSLFQLLKILREDEMEDILLKYGLLGRSLIGVYGEKSYQMRDYQSAFAGADQDTLSNMMNEIARTQKSIRTAFSPRDRFDKRWEDLKACLFLDGYHLDPEHPNDRFIPVEPQMKGQEPVEDDLTRALRSSALPQSGQVQRLLNQSAESFLRGDHNGCLTNARVALETLAKAIAAQRHGAHGGNYTADGWGPALAYLHISGFVSDRENIGLAGVYSFISEGAHVPLGFTEEEFVRFGRNLAVSMCYFLVKRYLGN